MPPRTLQAVTTCSRAMSHLLKSKALRTAVPGTVIQTLELERGSRLRWIVDMAIGKVSVQREPED